MNTYPVSRFVFLLCIISGFYLSVTGQESSKPAFNPDYTAALNYLFGLKTTGEVAEIKEKIIFSKDVAEFSLTEGKIFLW